MAPAPPTLLPLRTVLAGLQCVRRMWLEVHEPTRQGHPEARHVRRDESARVRALAEARFPGGLRIEGGADAVARTEVALTHEDIVYDAVVAASGVRVRIDILRRRGESWDLIDVRGGLKVKYGHRVDVALQRAIAQAAGLRIADAYIVHVRRVATAGTPAPDTHLRVVSITDRMPPMSVPHTAPLRAFIGVSHEPIVAVGDHCTTPWRCPYLAHCGAAGTRGMARPPEGAVEHAAQGLDWVSAELVHGLPDGPVHTLDFEAFQTGLPDHDDIVPFEAIPFLWVARRSDRPDSTVFLGTDTDPRREFVTSLLNHLDDGRPVLVWSNYEAKTLGRLAKRYPDLSERLACLRERLVDLHPAVRSGYWSDRLGGAYSVKAVAGAMQPDFSYADLAIDNGRDAALLGLGLRRELVSSDIADDLVAYCERDVLALEVVYRTLTAFGDRSGAGDGWDDTVEHDPGRG